MIKFLVRKFNNKEELNKFKSKVDSIREDELADGTLYLVYKKKHEKSVRN